MVETRGVGIFFADVGPSVAPTKGQAQAGVERAVVDERQVERGIGGGGLGGARFAQQDFDAKDRVDETDQAVGWGVG